MPLYDYECEKCGRRFEKEHPMAFSGKVKCPACHSTRAIKVFHAAGVHFKGSGFYVTDGSGSHGATNGNGNGSPASDAPAKKDKDSTAGKPVTKPPSKQES